MKQAKYYVVIFDVMGFYLCGYCVVGRIDNLMNRLKALLTRTKFSGIDFIWTKKMNGDHNNNRNYYNNEKWQTTEPKKQYLRTMSNGEKHGKLIIILPLSYYYDLWKNCVRKRMAWFVAFGCVLCVRMSERVRENQRAREMLGMIDKERKGKRYRVITCWCIQHDNNMVFRYQCYLKNVHANLNAM